MPHRSTQEVFQDHLALAQQGDVDTDIDRNFDPDCMLMTSYGNFRGHGGVREAAALLARQMGHGAYAYKRQGWHDELAFLEWTADTDKVSIPDGADSYWIRNGRIRAMTIHYSAQPKAGHRSDRERSPSKAQGANLAHSSAWPDLPYAAWKDTCTTLQLWIQIVGKIRLAQTPWINHSWHATLYLTARGLTTSPIVQGERIFQIDFDFISHELLIQTDDGSVRKLPLEAKSVAAFQRALFATLDEMGLHVTIHGIPNEMPQPIPFAEDTVHAAYEPEYAQRFWRVLLQADRVFKLFRTGFLGKSSPVHLFWGSFDLAVTRFSGRRAPPHPGGIPNLPDAVTREAYSHEVSSAGFWPGGGPVDYAAFYSYAYPTPEQYRQRAVKPSEAFFHAGAGEFILPYDVVRTAADPDQVLLEFLQSTYEAAAETAHWDRAVLECARGVAGKPRAYEAR